MSLPETLAKDAAPLGAPGRRYVIVMPTRDEEKFLRNTVESILGQSVLPTELVIVNDGSGDRTGEIAEELAAEHPWIHAVHRADRGGRKVGGGVVEAFYSGYNELRTKDWDYLVKLDADLTLPPGYFEGIFKKMEADPLLGSASGKVFNPVGDTLHEERLDDEMVSGAVKLYRRRCWDDIGGLVREVMWDGIDFHRARIKGWKTRSFRDEDLHIIHHRLMGSSHKSIVHGRLRWGRGQYFMGTHPCYIFASGVFRMRERPYVLGGLLIIAGYFQAMFQGMRRYEDLEFRRHLHNWQLKRIGLGFIAPKVEVARRETAAP
jgi:glycosyltransferase involved in cell wall biosynthesis